MKTKKIYAFSKEELLRLLGIDVVMSKADLFYSSAREELDVTVEE